MKNAWRQTCEETLARKSKQHNVYASTDTLKKMKARKKAKEVLNCSRTRAKKAEAQIINSESNKGVKRSISSEKTDGTSWMTSQDKHRKQQRRAIVKSSIPSQEHWQVPDTQLVYPQFFSLLSELSKINQSNRFGQNIGKTFTGLR